MILRRLRTTGQLVALGLSAVAVDATLVQDAQAWGLKTHAWIAQQVLNDALDDGVVTLPTGQHVAVPPHVLAALQAHPDRYRMGNLGPDVFPDPIVGQMTTHPGIPGGWQTDDWLKQVLGHATTLEEVAFAYGFAGHAVPNGDCAHSDDAACSDVLSSIARI